jgi:hypothetical protein
MSTKNDAGESRKAKIPQEMGKSVKKFTRQSWINLREYIFITFGLFIYAVEESFFVASPDYRWRCDGYRCPVLLCSQHTDFGDLFFD